MSPLTRGYLIALVGIALWSTTGVFISYLVTHYRMAPLLLVFWRELLVSVGLALTLAVIRRPLLRLESEHRGLLVAYGAILAVFNSIWVLSVAANGAAVATVLVYSSAGFTTLLAHWRFREALGPFKLLAVVLSLVGCVLVANAYEPAIWRLNLLGTVTGLLSGLLFAVYTLIGKEVSRRHINAWTALLYSFVFGSLFALIFNLVPGPPGGAGSLRAVWPDLAFDGWAVLLLLALGPTVLGFGLYNDSLRFLPASIANLLATTEPAMTAAIAYVFLGERMTTVQIIGGAIIVLAVVVIQFERREPTLGRLETAP